MVVSSFHWSTALWWAVTEKRARQEVNPRDMRAKGMLNQFFCGLELQETRWVTCLRAPPVCALFHVTWLTMNL